MSRAPGEMHPWNVAARARLPLSWIRQGWSARKLALAAGVDPSTLDGWLRGDNGMTERTLGKICAVLGADPGDITADVRCETCKDVPREGWLCAACAPPEELERVAEARRG